MDSSTKPPIAALLSPPLTSPCPEPFHPEPACPELACPELVEGVEGVEWAEGANELQPEQSLEDFFSETNSALDSIASKILAHASALPKPGETGNPEALKTSASVVRILETSIRALKRAQDIRIAQEKIVAPKKEAQANAQQDYETTRRDWIESIKRAREYRRIAMSHQRTPSSSETVGDSGVNSAPHAPEPEPDAPETAETLQTLPAAMVHSSSSTEQSSLSIAPDLRSAVQGSSASDEQSQHVSTWQCAEPSSNPAGECPSSYRSSTSYMSYSSAPDPELRSPDLPMASPTQATGRSGVWG